MTCGDWIVRKIMHGRYAIYENSRCYAILLDKRRYGKDILELLEAVIK